MFSCKCIHLGTLCLGGPVAYREISQYPGGQSATDAAFILSLKKYSVSVYTNFIFCFVLRLVYFCRLYVP